MVQEQLTELGKIEYFLLPDQDFRCSHIPVPARGEDKNRPAARWPHIDP